MFENTLKVAKRNGSVMGPYPIETQSVGRITGELAYSRQVTGLYVSQPAQALDSMANSKLPKHSTSNQTLLPTSRTFD
jgi:hypothetical protein